MKELDRIALFRLSVLGPLISRPSLEYGELQMLLCELAWPCNQCQLCRFRNLAIDFVRFFSDRNRQS